MKKQIITLVLSLLAASCATDSQSFRLIGERKVVVEMPMFEHQDIAITHVLERPGAIVTLVEVKKVSDINTRNIVLRHSDLAVPYHEHTYNQVVMYGEMDGLGDDDSETYFATCDEALRHYQKQGYQVLGVR